MAIDPTLKGDHDHRHRRSHQTHRRAPAPWAWHIRHGRPAPAPGRTRPWNGCKPWPQRFPQNMTVIVSAHRDASQSQAAGSSYGTRLASRYALAERTSLSAGPRPTIARSTLRSRPGRRAGRRHRLQPGPTPMHPAGESGTPNRRNGGHPHRPCTRSGGSQLVRPAFWIELGFRGPQEPGCEVGQTRRTSPAASGRDWLALSVATLLALALCCTRVQDAQGGGLLHGNLRALPKGWLPDPQRPVLEPSGAHRERDAPIDWL